MNIEPRDDLYKRRATIALGGLFIAAIFSLVAVIRSHVAVTENTFFRTPPELFSLYSADFLCFYAAAQVGAKSLSSVYDPAILDAAQASVTAAAQANNPHYIYAYPPFITKILIPFSYLSFGMAYYSWMVISYLLAACAVFLCAPVSFTRHQKILCGAVLPLVFPFFSFTALMAGQLSSIGLFIFALVVKLRKVSPFWAGIALSLGLYKPPLFVGYAALALIAREWRLIQGAFVGVLAIAGLSIAFTGEAPWRDFLVQASGYVYGGALSDGRNLPAEKGMGLLSAAVCSTGSTTAGWVVFLILFVVAVVFHSRTHHQKFGNTELTERCEQASRITLTYLLSIQALNYDAAILLVPIMLVGSAYVIRAPALLDLYLFVFSLLFLIVAGTMDTENGSGISTGAISVIVFWLVLIRAWKHSKFAA